MNAPTAELKLIPLSKLKASKLNVRKTGGKAVAELAASIRAAGLQQNLGVVPDGNSYGVVFGGRRLRALQQLQKAGELPEALASGVPCRVIAADEAQEASLAENTLREAMHPLDQFAAFQSLVDEDKSEADVAARFGVTEVVVRQRLRLARVSPKLLNAYGEGDMRLDQLQAYAVTDDHARQEAHWKRVRGDNYGSTPDRIRSDLLQQEVSNSDPRVRLVGLAAYEAAGGQVRRDLFSDTAVVLDVPLLDRLARDAVEQLAELVRADGWFWVEVRASRPAWNEPYVDGEDRDYSEAENREAEALEERQDLTLAEHMRLWSLDSPLYTPEQKAACGVVLVLGRGGVEFHQGRLRDGAPPPPAPEVDDDDSDLTQAGSSVAAKPTKLPGDPSFAAVQRLQAEANAIVQLKVAREPITAMALLVARLANDLYTGWDGPRRWVHIGREASGRTHGPHRQVVDASAHGTELRALEGQWRAQLPAKAIDLPGWAMQQTPDVLQQLLAYLVAREIEVVDAAGGGRSDQGVVAIAELVGADIVAEWRPTLEWLATLPKPVILAMVEDAVDKKAASRLAGLKKDQLPAAALPLFPVWWLPKALRAPKAKPAKKAKG